MQCGPPMPPCDGHSGCSRMSRTMWCGAWMCLLVLPIARSCGLPHQPPIGGSAAEEALPSEMRQRYHDTLGYVNATLEQQAVLLDKHREDEANWRSEREALCTLLVVGVSRRRSRQPRWW